MLPTPAATKVTSIQTAKPFRAWDLSVRAMGALSSRVEGQGVATARNGVSWPWRGSPFESAPERAQRGRVGHCPHPVDRQCLGEVARVGATDPDRYPWRQCRIE